MITDKSVEQNTQLEDIKDIAKKIGLNESSLELYGNKKAKINYKLQEGDSRKKGKLILVTATNPTPAGEGKTTTTIGLGQALWKLDKKAIIALREPSLGPCMGLKGGATGGGYSQVFPTKEINLHFTGDMHAITSAHNLIAAVLDNHIHRGNELKVDLDNIQWPRTIDMNDRTLREVTVGLGEKNGVERKESFIITAASEVMAVLCLSEDLKDLKERLGKIIVAYSVEDEPVTVNDLKIAGALTLLLEEAIKPNLVQTAEGTPAIIHGGPFANVAHACNSVIATKTALELGEVVVTEAGFGADLGAEKFFDIKCRLADLKPDAVVLVTTIRSMKYNGGVKKKLLKEIDSEAVKRGVVNLIQHVENLRKFKIPVIVTLNKFVSDTKEEIAVVREACKEIGVDFTLSEVWEKGGDGGIKLAEKVLDRIENIEKNEFECLYDVNSSIKEKINTVATEIYRADSVIFTENAKKDIERINRLGYNKLPICIAKTPYSFSDNGKLLGVPRGFDIHVRKIYVSAGAGFLVVLTEDILTMPGLPKKPLAESLDI